VVGRPVLIRGGIRGASRRPAHLRDLTPAPMIGGASSKGVTLSGAKLAPPARGAETKAVWPAFSCALLCLSFLPPLQPPGALTGK
jgi:hypothetical protein